MNTDDESIRDACKEVGSFLRELEARALRARTAKEDGTRRIALADVHDSVGAITAALERVTHLAAGRDRAVRTGIPDPVPDLDQEPQD